MKQNEKFLFTLKGGDQFLIKCAIKEKPFYTYRHTYLVSTTKEGDFDLLARMALCLAEEDRVKLSHKEFKQKGMCFQPYFETSEETSENGISSFILTIVFPYDD